MSFYTIRRLLTAAVREGLVYYAANVGERLARKHIRLATKSKANPKRRRRKGKR